MTQCIMYRRWHVRAILWRAVWEIDELAKDCSSEVTEERELINDHRLARKGSGRRLGTGQKCSVFHVFGAPKKINVCGRVTVERTKHTHTAEKVVPSNMCSFVGRNGWSGGHRVHRCSLVLGSWRGGRQDHAADRVICAVTSKAVSSCDTHGSTRSVTGKHLEWTRYHRTDQDRTRSSSSLSLLVAFRSHRLPWWTSNPRRI
jgi:hypothetical protein